MPTLIAAALAAVVTAGCQSTQDRSAEIAASLGPVRQEKGLKITDQSKDVEVVSTTLLTDKYGSAVVVRLRNTSDQDLTDVPVAIDVLDAQGKSVYRNDIPGIEPALASMPLIRAGEEADWVHNQVLAVGKPDSVEVEVGASKTTLAGELPDISVSEPALEKDPVSGVAATGAAVNNTDTEQGRLLLFGVARDGDQVVAAGRGAIDEFKPGKRINYDVFFIGDPEGAEVTVTSFPTPERP
jgi:hypothetical protein